jgi:hypothetical protein
MAFSLPAFSGTGIYFAANRSAERGCCAQHRQRIEIKEARRHRSSRKESKYFVAKANGWMLLVLALGVPMLVLVSMFFHLVPKEWEFPMLAVFMGAAIVITVVQPWLRHTASFWISLVVSCTVQVLVGYWLTMHLAPQTRSELKGAAVLAIVPGYAVGILSYFLLQKLGLGEGPRLNSR